MKWNLAKKYRLPSQNAENLNEQDVKELREIINAYTKHNREMLVRLKDNEPKYGVSPVVRGLRNKYKNSGLSQEQIDVGQSLGTKYLGKEATKSQLLNEYYYQKRLASNPYISSKEWKKESLKFRKDLEEELDINVKERKTVDGEEIIEMLPEKEQIHFTAQEASELYGIFDRLKESGYLTSEYYAENRLSVAKEFIKRKRSQKDFNKDEFEREISDRLREDYERAHTLGQGNTISSGFKYVPKKIE